MFYDSFKKFCDAIEKTPTSVAKEIGFSANAPHAWKNGKIPSSKSVQRIADFFGISTDELLNRSPSKLCHEEGKKIAFLSTIGAGIPMEAIKMFDQDDDDSWKEILKMDARKGEYFGLRIHGNSMEPEIKHGDIVIVRLCDGFEDGDMVIALVNGDEGLCKILRYRDNGISLCSLNPEYPPMIFTREQIENLPVRLVGIVEEVRHKVRR